MNTTTLRTTSAPAIGTYWPEQGGTYAGTIRGQNGQPDYHLIVASGQQENVEALAALDKPLEFGGYGKDIAGARSFADGAANTRAMLRDRISALREANIYEKQAYRHVLGMPCVLEESAGGVRSETAFFVVRIMRDGTSDLFATGRYLDRYEIQNETALLKERIVVCDSSRIDTLLAIR